MFPIRDHNPSRRTPFVTIALIAANVIAFALVWPLHSDERALFEFYANWALVPGFVAAGEGYTGFLTSMFLHAGLLHLAGNMLFLWVFGDNLEDQLGHGGFLAFYLLTGLAAGLTHVVADPASFVPTIGASGAVAGVMGGYLLMYPRARVDVLFFFIIIVRIIPIPAWIVLGAWFALQLFNGVAGPVDAGVAYWAHAGGFVAGLLLMIRPWIRRGADDYWKRTDGHPPHPEAKYRTVRTNIPRVRRRR